MAYVYVQPFPFAFGGGFCGAGGSPSCRASACAGAWDCSRRSPSQTRERASVGFGRVQSIDNESSYLIFVPTRGLRREDVALAAEDGRLVLTATQDGEVVVERMFEIPTDVLPDGVSAKLDRGELTITLLKQPKLNFEVPVEGGETANTLMDTEAPAALEAGPSDAPVSDANEPVKEGEADGSWVDVADEEKKAADAKGKAPMDAAVLMEFEHQAGAEQTKAGSMDEK